MPPRAPKPKTVESPYLVLCDVAEQKPWIFPPGGRCLGTAIVNLFTADYSLEGYYDQKILCVERKGAVAELVGNLTQAEKADDFRQLLERMDELAHPFVVCEFPRSHLFTYPESSDIPRKEWPKVRVTPQYLLKVLSTVELKYKSKWLFFNSPDEAVRYVETIFKRVAEGVH
jgi:hypothetical protein